MKSLNFKSQREERVFNEYLKGIETILNISIEDLYKSEKNSIKALILIFARRTKEATEEKIEIAAGIIKKFLGGAQKYRKKKTKGNSNIFAAHVAGLYRSLIAPPKTAPNGRKRAINLTSEETNLIHKEKEK